VSVVANVAINVDSRGAVGKLREVSTQAQATQKAFGALQQAAAAFGAGFAISQVIADVKQLDTNLRRLGTVGGNVAALDKGLGDLSKQLEGVANKAELAAASYQALSAGFTETSANLRIVEAATKAAVGGLVDVTSVVEVTTKTLNAYGLSGEYAIKVTDSISKAVEFGQVQWSDYTSQLGRVASIAALAGVSIDEINAFIAAATKNGATAEVAFTGLGAALATLLQPTEQSKKAAEALGIQWNVAGLQSRGFSGLLQDLSKKQDANKTAVAELLGSQEALRGVLAANSKAGKDYRMILEGLGGATGKTEADFEKMRGSLENTLKSLDTAFKNFSEALGKAFGPTVVVVIRDITGAVNGFAAAFNAVPQPVLKATAEVVKAVAQLLLLKKAIEGIIALRVALIGMFAATATGAGTAAVAASGLTMNMRYLQGSMATATTQGTALAGVLRSIAAFGVITVGINLIVTGLQEAMTAAAEVRKLRGERARGGAAAIYGGSATADQKAAARQTLEAARKEQRRYRDPGTVAAQTLLGPLAPVFGVPTTAQAGRRRPVLQERVRRAEAVLALPTRTQQQAGIPTPPPTPQEQLNLDGGGRTRSGGKTAADKAAAEEARIQARIRGLQIETQATQQLAVLRGRIAEAEMAGNEELAIRLRGVEREQQILVQYQQSIGDVTDQRLRQAMEAKALADLEMAGMETAIDLEKQRLKLLKEQNDEFFKRAGLTPQDKMPSGAGAFDPSLPDLRVSPAEQQMAAYRAELDALTNPINMAVTGANAIGDAFGQAFQDIATGAKSTEQALADTFKAIGEAFISMAVQIIAKQIAMITFQTLLKALGGGGSFGFGGAGPYQMPSGGGFAQGFSLPKLNATGSMVTGPTNAIIGEAGPEAVMPLQRGTDGKMGVQIADNRAFLDSLTTGFTAAIDEASDDPAAAATDNRASLREVERLQENRTQVMTQQMEAERRYERERIEQMASTPGNLNIKYESQVINNVEYVTRDQAERMAAQSALRGRELAIGALQNSVKTRKRVGI
jgi:TP901 family phage tail tape measure protein